MSGKNTRWPDVGQALVEAACFIAFVYIATVYGGCQW
jgi:hypothetical protein